MLDWSKINACSLDEASHVYTVAGIPSKYGSVTALVAKHFSKFNAADTCARFYTRWANNSSHKYYKMISEMRLQGVADASIQTTIVDRWTEQGRAAAHAGTHLHKQIELFLKGEAHESSDEMDKFVAWWQTVGQVELIGCELPLALMQGGKPLVCGTLDCLIRTKNGYAVLDWKRTIHIADNGFGKYGTGVLDKLEDTKFNRYRLQLSIYAHILFIEHNIDCFDHLYLIKVHSDLECPEIVPAPPLREEAAALLSALEVQIV